MGRDKMKKRRTPSEEKLLLRKEILSSAKDCLTASPPAITAHYPDGMEPGNKKTGKAGKNYTRVYVWNLPYVITCPGATKWCLQHCYNADPRKDVYPIERWCENLWWYQNSPELLESIISAQLNSGDPLQTAVRLHSCGDFFSGEYIDFWKKLIVENPSVHFWAYTRSWRVDSLRGKIIELSRLNNFQLFASCDQDEDAPVEMRKSFVYQTDDELLKACTMHQHLISCPEQYCKVSCCADCGICIEKGTTDVGFLLH